MARPVSGDKHADIRKATVRETVENGISRASVNRIAARAGVSVGTIYRYFENKDDLLASVHLLVKQDVHDALMTAANRQETSASRIRALWFVLLDYASEHPDDFVYAEIVGNEVTLSADRARRIEDMAGDIRGILRTAIEDGTLAPAALPALMAVLTAPAMQLARRAAIRRVRPDRALAEEIFEITWRAIASR